MSARTKAVVAAAVVVAVALSFWFVITLRYGFSVHDEPTRIESLIARGVRHWAVPSDLRDMTNPVALTPAVLAEARAHFADHCAICHGNDGKGVGTLASRMYPRAPDMTLQPTQSLSDGELFSIIENGVRLTGMPGFGSGTAESAYGSWTLVHFIRHLPELSPEEIREMERLNPRTPAQLEELKAEEEFLSGESPEAPDAHHHEEPE